MIFIDSWVWLEFFQEGDKADRAEEIIGKIEEEAAVISSTVLMEVRYRVKRKFGRQKTDKLTGIITSFENLKIMPVTEEVAVYAADLRHRYYDRSENQVSYADAIHVATAAMTGSEKLYTGDPDFRGVEEVDTEVV